MEQETTNGTTAPPLAARGQLGGRKTMARYAAARDAARLAAKWFRDGRLVIQNDDAQFAQERREFAAHLRVLGEELAL